MFPYDRNHSAGGAGSPPQYSQAPSPFPSRQMPQMPPPRSPPPLTSNASSLPGSAPRGPPISSPFPGIRDLASLSSRRPAGGMSISSMLGGNDDRPSAQTTPHASPPKSMRPPSPGRARSSSMRESTGRSFGDNSPPRAYMGEPRPMTAAYGLERTASEQPRRDGLFGGPPHFHRETANNFRAFNPTPTQTNGHAPPGRPSSQPIEPAAPRGFDDYSRREPPPDSHLSEFRHTVDRHVPPPPPPNEMPPRHEPNPYQNGHGPTSQPAERNILNPPAPMEHDRQSAAMRFHPGSFGTPMREEQTGLFLPAYSALDRARESIESRSFHDRPEIPRSSPPVSDLGSFERHHMGFTERPMTWEEHQRAEAIHRGQQLRKEIDPVAHRSFLSISPELNRRGRNSPLPQAVQGAQPKHVGPGGDNPGIKMEFGRMFSGLGSGVGSNTPAAGHNGTTTPSRSSPIRQIDGSDVAPPATSAEVEDGRAGPKATKTSRKERRAREDGDRVNGRETPDVPYKRTKTTHAGHHHHHHPTHAHHHHHHHHHAEPDNGPSPFNMIRFPSNNSFSHSTAATTNPSHHHHHHDAHPKHHHHHHPPVHSTAPAPRKPTTTVNSSQLLAETSKKPRKHLGSTLYTTFISAPATADFTADSRIKYRSGSRAIPLFEGKENCTFTVRVPRWYLASSEEEGDPNASALEEVCKRRQVWGTDVYTDDSNVIAAAVHAGWIRGDFGEGAADLQDIFADEDGDTQHGDDGPANGVEASKGEGGRAGLSLTSRPRRPIKPPRGLDAHITLLILPPLQAYTGTNRHHLWSRYWNYPGPTNTSLGASAHSYGDGGHDGMSFMIHRIDFVDEGIASRFQERSAAARKKRLAREDASRREAAAGLVLFAKGRKAVGGGARGGIGGGVVRVGA